MRSAVGLVEHRDRLGRSVDGPDLMSRPNVDRQGGPESGWRHDEQSGTLRNGAPDVVGQAAVRVTDVFASFEQNDLGLFVQTTKTGGGGRASRDSTHDDIFGQSGYLSR